ncbi:hypothetical protein QJQ45_013900, partial [Haematococcus lacustris]
KCQARHVFIDTKGLYGLMRDAGMLGVLTEEGVTSLKKSRNGALPDPAEPGKFIEGPKDSQVSAPCNQVPASPRVANRWDALLPDPRRQKLASPKHSFAQIVHTDGVSSKPSSLALYRQFTDTAEVPKPRWANAKFRLYCGKHRVVVRFWSKQLHDAVAAQASLRRPSVWDAKERYIVPHPVSETTSSANIGMSIARLGYKVALIDADIGLRNLDLLLGLENRILYTAIDILEGDCRLDQALVRDKRWKNLALLSIYSITRKHMDELCDAIISLGYQYIIIDCPAGIDVGFINAISPAKEALIVTTPEITSIRDADRVAGLLEANSILNVKLLVNRVRPEMIEKNDMMSVKDVQEMLGIPLLGAIPEDPQVIVSTNRGEPLVLQKKLTLSGIAYENAARRLIGKQDYFLDLSNPTKGMFQRFTEMFQG